jgi:hypothetical protein
VKGYVSQDSLQKAEGDGSGSGYAILALDNDDLWWREMSRGGGGGCGTGKMFMRKMAMIKGVPQACAFLLTPRRQQALAADPKVINALRKERRLYYMKNIYCVLYFSSKMEQTQHYPSNGFRKYTYK